MICLCLPLIVILVLLILLVCFYLYCQHCFLYWKKRCVKFLKPSFPFGNITQLVFQEVSFGKLFADIYDNFKCQNLRYGGVFMFTKPVFVPVSLEVIRDILTKNFDSFTDRPMYCNPQKDPLSAHLFTLPGEQWRGLRRNITPIFSSGKIRKMFPIIQECCQDMIRVLSQAEENGGLADMKEIFANLTTDIIGACAFGIKCNSLICQSSEFTRNCKLFVRSSTSDTLKILLSVTFTRFLKFFRVRVVKKQVSDFFIRFIRDAIRRRRENRAKIDDFLSCLMKLMDDGSISFEQLAAQAFVFFIAGFETTSTTLNFCLLELALNQDIQDRLRREISTKLKDNSGRFSYDSIMDMDYMDLVVNGNYLHVFYAIT